MSDIPATPGAAKESHAPAGDFWAAVREALRGSDRDYTEGDVGRSILILAIPMVLEMAMESVFAVVDVFFVGRLGPSAVATVGLTESMLTLVYALAMGLSIGATAVVARRIGEKDPEGAAESAAQAIMLALGASVVIGVAGATLAPTLLRVMGAEADVLRTGVPFTRVMLGGSASVLMLFLVNAIFRGAGNPVIAMHTLWLANAINIVLGPCLIFGLGPFPRLGIAGAAIATTIGRSTGALFALVRLLRGDSRVPLAMRHFRPNVAIMGRILSMSSSATFQVFVGMASWIGLIRILSTFGSAALAGYTIGVRVIIFALLPSWGLANAAATMVGQALGAQKPDRAEAAVWKAGLLNAWFLGAIGIVFVVFAPQIVRVFSSDPVVIPYGVSCLRIVAAGFLFYAYGMVVTQAFNGAGDTWTPTWINIGIFWLFEIPLAWALAKTAGWGPRGIFVAIMISYAALAVVSALVFRRGTWRTRRV